MMCLHLYINLQKGGEKGSEVEVTGGRKTRLETISKQVGDKVHRNPNSDSGGQEWRGFPRDV